MPRNPKAQIRLIADAHTIHPYYDLREPEQIDDLADYCTRLVLEQVIAELRKCFVRFIDQAEYGETLAQSLETSDLLGAAGALYLDDSNTCVSIAHLTEELKTRFAESATIEFGDCPQHPTVKDVYNLLQWDKCVIYAHLIGT